MYASEYARRYHLEIMLASGTYHKWGCDSLRRVAAYVADVKKNVECGKWNVAYFAILDTRTGNVLCPLQNSYWQRG